MTSTRRQRTDRGTLEPQDSNDEGQQILLGAVLVAVAVALGIILLLKGGGVGYENDAKDVKIGNKDESGQSTNTTVTTQPAPSTSVPPAQLKIAVLNGAGKSGFAGAGANFLSVAGYPTVTAGNAAAAAQTTAVYFAPGFEEDARAVAKVLSVGEVQPLPETGLGRTPKDVPEGTAVVAVLGPDVESVITPAGDTTTTAPTTTAATGGN